MSWFNRPLPQFCYQCGEPLELISHVTRWDEATGEATRVQRYLACNGKPGTVWRHVMQHIGHTEAEAWLA